MSHSPDDLAPRLTSGANSPKRPQINTAVERVWMVCFWAMFIFLLLFGTLCIAGAVFAHQSVFRLPEPTGAMSYDFALFIWDAPGLFANLGFAVFGGVFGLVACARARKGLKSTGLLIALLTVRLPWIAAVGVASLVLAYSPPPHQFVRQVQPDMLGIALFDLPVAIYGIGCLVARRITDKT